MKNIKSRASLTSFLPQSFYFSNQKYVAGTYRFTEEQAKRKVWNSLLTTLEGYKDDQGNIIEEPQTNFETLISYIGKSTVDKEYLISIEKDGSLYDSAGGAAELGLILPSKEDSNRYLELISSKNLEEIRKERDKYSDKEGALLQVLINLKSSLHKKSLTGAITTIELQGKTIGEKRDTLNKDLKNSDGLIISNIRDSNTTYKSKDNFEYDVNKEEGTYVVFEPEQIHILGSKQDIEGFKDFVNKNKSLNNIEQAFKCK